VEIDVADDHRTAQQALPPHRQLMQMGSAYRISRILYAAAKLGLADQLASGPRSALELADTMQVHAPSLHRLMRTLASLGILSERSERRYALTALGEALQTDVPGSAKAYILVGGSRWFQSAWDHIVQSVETGKTGFEMAQGMRLFDYLARHPEDASLFSETMALVHSEETLAVAAAYDFSVFKTIVDVGGATGDLLAGILAQHAGPRGVLFDRAHVLVEASIFFEARSVRDRVTIEPGDFFTAVPADGDAYVLSHVIHDWNDDQCLTILGNVRKAMHRDGRLLIVEIVMPQGDMPHFSKLLDMTMLVTTGGQERTKAEYDQLLHKAGFQLIRVLPTNSQASLIEALCA
jgi:hypothetical protein